MGADLAEAILRVYPTPLSLRTAYEAGMKGAPAGQAVTAAQRLLEGVRVSPPARSARSSPLRSLTRYSPLGGIVYSRGRAESVREKWRSRQQLSQGFCFLEAQALSA